MEEFRGENNEDLVITGNENAEPTIDIELPFIRNLAGWATFKAIIDIIAGALSCLGIITAAFGIPLIIAGIRLLNASDDLKRFISTNDTQRIGDVLYNFNKYFKLSGISIIIRIVFVIIAIILYVIIIAYLLTYMGDYFRYLPESFMPYQ